ncbi:PilZ domain-containing protein [Caenimonas terrae]|uniref:PilZ domain-containing protein n=1 Tax=Caenimonas terrae TaxID=696074 RepID=A0ABW0NCK3_9BURK
MASESLTAIPPLAASNASDQRAAARFGVGMPYTVDGHEGQTRDLSATGLSFESDTDYPVGSLVDLTLRYGLDGHNFPMACQVEVVRVEPCGPRFMVAARWCQPFDQPDE